MQNYSEQESGNICFFYRASKENAQDLRDIEQLLFEDIHLFFDFEKIRIALLRQRTQSKVSRELHLLEKMIGTGSLEPLFNTTCTDQKN